MPNYKPFFSRNEYVLYFDKGIDLYVDENWWMIFALLNAARYAVNDNVFVSVGHSIQHTFCYDGKEYNEYYDILTSCDLLGFVPCNTNRITRVQYSPKRKPISKGN